MQSSDFLFYMVKHYDITGQTFGRLTAVKFIKRRNGLHYWLFKCKCGTEKVIQKSNVKSGHTKSCGCWKREKVTTHGQSKTVLYGVWSAMKARCNNKNNKDYKWYGKRGIKLCKRWQKFENFRDDMYGSYKKHVQEFGRNNTTIDRLKNNGHYCKENCCWTTWKIQANNRRNSF